MLGTIAGNVIHEALELLLRELHKGRCASIRDPAAVAVLRALGGYSSIVERQVERDLAKLEGNPRAAPLLSSLRRNLLNRIPELRQKVQALLARAAWTGPIGEGPVLSGGQPRPLGMGSHTEVELVARDLRFCGRVDLITVDEDACVITDFKTGAPDSKHADQVRAYAVLWHRDGDRNPGGLGASRLVIVFSDHDVTFDGPSSSELDEIADDLAARIADAEAGLEERPPPARPAADVCRFCDVRQLCDEYWNTPDDVASPPASSGRPTATDIEGVIASRNGPRSWNLLDSRTEETVLLRTPTEAAPFSAGDRVRILHALQTASEDEDGSILSMTVASETFVLREI
jgi:hypothetical protein